jgi:hypothetical protein
MNKWVHKEEVELENSWNTGPLISCLWIKNITKPNKQTKKYNLKRPPHRHHFNTPKKKEG